LPVDRHHHYQQDDLRIEIEVFVGDLPCFVAADELIATDAER
jgi:hypothetical protein